MTLIEALLFTEIKIFETVFWRDYRLNLRIDEKQYWLTKKLEEQALSSPKP